MPPLEIALSADDGRREESGEETLVGGLNAVLAALRNRPRACRRLLLAEGRHSTPRLTEICELARAQGVPIRPQPRIMLDRRYGRPEHQGVLAFFEALEYREFDDFLSRLPDQGPALVLALDQVADPGNLGALLRGAAAFEALGVFWPRRRAAALTPAALNASAGAAESLALMRVGNLVRSLAAVKEKGFWVVGSDGGAETGLFDFSFPERTVLLLGSEGRGLGPLALSACDFQISIPQNTVSVSSLNVAAAGAILMYEYRRQMALRSPAAAR